MWLDGIYMLDVFYARWTYEFEPDNTTAWVDIALQFDLIDADDERAALLCACYGEGRRGYDAPSACTDTFRWPP
jgi:hypothetical protein